MIFNDFKKRVSKPALIQYLAFCMHRHMHAHTQNVDYKESLWTNKIKIYQ